MSRDHAMPEIDLETCQREPVHAPGAVQPHGFFFALHPKDGAICATSENLPGQLGLEGHDRLIGLKPAAVVDDDSALQIAEMAAGRRRLIPFAVRLTDERHCWATPYRTDGVLAVELEPDDPDDGSNEASLAAMDAMSRLRQIDGLEDLTEEIARAVREILGFDRTMVYQFDGEYNGTVVAEAMARALGQSFLGLSFPHSDIPSQARALFARNRIRAIPRVSDERAVILPAVNPLTRTPFDLSDSNIRSVSPIHIEYLRNMGVGGSFTISLLEGRELWGLIACHHETERRVSPRARTPCLLMCEAFSSRVAEIQAEQRGTRLTDKLRRMSQVYTQDFDVADLQDPTGFLSAVASDVLEILEADGIWIQIDRFSARAGDLPSDPLLDEVCAAAREASGPFPRRLVITDTLETLGMAPTQDCAGVLYHQLPARRGHILAIRKEQAEMVNWAGDPDRKVLTDPATMRLHPRKSFETFQALRRGRSARWPDETAAIAPDLATTLTRFTEMLRDLAEQELRGSIADLEQSVYVASHDLQEPLRMVTSYLNLIATKYQGKLDKDADEFIGFAVDGAQRMRALISDLLAFSRIRSQERELVPVSCESVLDQVRQLLQVQIADSAATISHDPLPTVYGDEVQLIQLFQNLIGNAIKYRSERPPRLHIAAERSGSRWLLSLSDNGIGIAPESRERVFQIFHRLHGRDAYAGNGIGLTICKRIVERHHGRIWADGALDGGTVFHFTLTGTREENRNVA